jgi:hypothetical protein
VKIEELKSAKVGVKKLEEALRCAVPGGRRGASSSE